MLYPIYDTPTNMLFTQGAIHRTDDRTQSNIGFGWRHFSGNDWMAGVNTFIDHDLSRSHTWQWKLKGGIPRTSETESAKYGSGLLEKIAGY